MCIRDRLNTPRYMSVPGIFECYDKPLEVFDYNALKDDPLIATDTIGLKGSTTTVYKSFAPVSYTHLHFLLVQSSRDNSGQRDGVDLRLAGIAAAGQAGGDLGAGQDAAVLAIGSVDQRLVDEVAGLDVGEQQDRCV